MNESIAAAHSPYEQDPIDTESLETPAHQRITKEEVWEMTKPWLGATASVLGVKSLYDLPEYFRERYMLRGTSVGGVQLGGKGLVGSSEELLEANQAQREEREQKEAAGLPTRGELYEKLTELENQNETESEEYKALEAQLNTTRPTAVREAIDDLNRRLSLTKEGGQKGSEARQEMARILREHRNTEQVDREKVRLEINTLLDDYTNQKVDGITAAKEGLRSVLLHGSGATLLAAISTLSLDAAGFANEVKQVSKREGKEFNGMLLAKRFGEAVKDNWQKLRGVNTTEQKGLGRIWIDRAGAAAKFARVGGILGGATFNSETLEQELGKLAETSIENVPANFTEHLHVLGERLQAAGSNVAVLGERLQAAGSSVASFFTEDAGANTVDPHAMGLEEAATKNIDAYTTPKFGSINFEDDIRIVETEEDTVTTDSNTHTATPGAGSVSPAEDIPHLDPETQAALQQEIDELHAIDQAAETKASDLGEPTVDRYSDQGERLDKQTAELIQDEIKTQNAEALGQGEKQADILMKQGEGMSGSQADAVYRQDFEGVEKDIAALRAEINKTPDYTVNPGDNIWKIIENKLEAHDLFRGLEEGQQTHMIDELKDRVTNMSQEELKEFGIASGDPNIIQPGEKLDFSKIMGGDEVEDAIAHAENLTPQQIEQIETYTPPHPDTADATAATGEAGSAEFETVQVEDGSEQQAQLREQEAGLHDNTLLREQAAPFAAEAAIKNDLNEMYGSRGLFGIFRTEGIESANWLDLKDRTVTEVFAKKFDSPFSEEETYESMRGIESEPVVNKMQHYLHDLMQKSGLEPSPKETVSQFIFRAKEELFTPE